MTGRRKFYMSLLVILLSAAMVFTGKMEAAGWITLASLALSIYVAGNVTDKKLGGQG